jgi:hypothetical protein
MMQYIFEREFRREKNLEVAKKQAELKKPVKKDNNINDKKIAMQQQQLVDIEEKFLKYVGADLEEFEKNKNQSIAQKPAA